MPHSESVISNSKPTHELANSNFAWGSFAWQWKDYVVLLFLVIWGVAFNFLGLGVLEYFRHTEADRTLIGWEMYRTGNYIVPHLLGSPVLTKPPLFFWAIAFAISLFGEPSEWVGRAPSATAAMLLSLAQYVFLRYVGAPLKTAFIGAIFLSASSFMFLLGAVAEIDMMFTLFCSLSLYLVYISTGLIEPIKVDITNTVANSFYSILIAYVFAALAFLTKGPPVVFFFAAAQVLFCLWLFVFARQRAVFFTNGVQSLKLFIYYHAIGVGVFICIVGVWVLALTSQVGFSTLGRELDIEIIQRVIATSSRGRGVWFYIQALLVGLLPWTPFAIVGLSSPVFARSINQTSHGENRAYWQFFVFNFIVVVSSFVMLSCAHGKSSRYIFPIFPFWVNFALFGVLYLCQTKSLDLWYRVGKTIALICGAIVIPVILILRFIIPEMSSTTIVANLVVVFMWMLAMACLWFGCVNKDSKRLLCAIFLSALCIRYGYSYLFVTVRNQSRSVKPVAASIIQEVPTDAPLYTLEMFERWVVYYVMRGGKDVIRLTPSNVLALQEQGKDIYLLLNVEEESWRKEQMVKYRDEIKVLKEYPKAKNPIEMELELVRVPAKALSCLTISARVPTKESDKMPSVCE